MQSTAKGISERIIPADISDEDIFGKQSLQLHVERYHFADKNLATGRILDIACGVGYGSSLLSKNSNVQTITAVDISQEAIDYGKSNYADQKINFVCSDVLSFNDDKGFNTIVSLETIEHIKNPERILQHFYKLLLPAGRLIISAPVTPSVDANPYHVNDFTPASFRKLCISAGFKEINSLKQVQPYSLKQVLPGGKNEKEEKRSLLKYYLTHPGKFFLRLKSLLTDGLKNKYLILVLARE